MPITAILAIIEVALNALANNPKIGADAELAAVFTGIIQKAMVAYQQAAGAPLDLSKLPIEAKVS